jgi:UDP:flavonoid glycosyltransferase YjiC (YdhE family)
VQYALRHARPLVAAGTTEEKGEVCARVAWAGVGRNLATDAPSEALLRESVRAVLGDADARRRVRALADRIAESRAPETAADALEAVVGDAVRIPRPELRGRREPAEVAPPGLSRN